MNADSLAGRSDLLSPARPSASRRATRVPSGHQYLVRSSTFRRIFRPSTFRRALRPSPVAGPLRRPPSVAAGPPEAICFPRWRINVSSSKNNRRMKLSSNVAHFYTHSVCEALHTHTAAARLATTKQRKRRRSLSSRIYGKTSQ